MKTNTPLMISCTLWVCVCAANTSIILIGLGIFSKRCFGVSVGCYRFCHPKQDMLESSTWKDCCGVIAPAWSASSSTGRTSECALGSQQTATVGANSSPKGLEDFGAEARELEVIRLADLHAGVSHIQEVRALVAGFVEKGRGKHETASSPLPRRPSQPTSKDPAFTSQHEPCAASCASTAASQLRQKDCSQAAVVVVENVAASGGNTISPPLVPRGSDGSRTAGLGSKAAFVAQLLVQVRGTSWVRSFS